MARCEFDPEDMWDDDVIALATRTVSGAVRRIQQIDTTLDFTANTEEGLSPPGTLHDTSKTYLVNFTVAISPFTVGIVTRIRIVSTTEIGITINAAQSGVRVTGWVVEVW